MTNGLNGPKGQVVMDLATTNNVHLPSRGLVGERLNDATNRILSLTKVISDGLTNQLQDYTCERRGNGKRIDSCMKL